MGNYVARAPAHFLENPNATNVVLDKLNGVNMREKLEGWEFLVEVVSNLGMVTLELCNNSVRVF